MYTQYTLGDVCSRLSSGKSISASEVTDKGLFPVYGGNGLRGYADKSNFTGECAIIGRQGAFCGNVHYFSGEAYMTEHAVVVCANEEHNTRYLAYLLSQMNLGRLSGQSAQPGLSVKTLAKQCINLPPLEIQNKIVSVLASLDSKIYCNQKINDNLEQQLHQLFIQTFNGCDTNITLGKVVKTTSGGTPARKHREYYSNGTINWVKSKELTGQYLFDTEESLTSLGVAMSSAKILPAHSVLIAMYGATVGEHGITTKEMACNQAICALLENKDYPYTYLFQIAKENQQNLVNLAIGSAQQNISQILLKQLPVHSDVATIHQYHCLALPLHKEIELLQSENRLLNTTRDALLPELMTGELDLSSVDF